MRLALDIEHPERFSGNDDRGSKQLRLIRAMPAFTPAAGAIVTALMDTYGAAFFTERYAGRLQAVVRFGPVQYAHLVLAFEDRFPTRPLSPLAARFQTIFERYPSTAYAEAHSALKAIGLPLGNQPPP